MGCSSRSVTLSQCSSRFHWSSFFRKSSFRKSSLALVRLQDLRVGGDARRRLLRACDLDRGEVLRFGIRSHVHDLDLLGVLRRLVAPGLGGDGSPCPLEGSLLVDLLRDRRVTDSRRTSRPARDPGRDLRGDACGGLRKEGDRRGLRGVLVRVLVLRRLGGDEGCRARIRSLMRLLVPPRLVRRLDLDGIDVLGLVEVRDHAAGAAEAVVDVGGMRPPRP